MAFKLGDCAARVLITWGGVLDEAAKGAAEAGVADVFVVGADAGHGTVRRSPAPPRPDAGRWPRGPGGHRRDRLHLGHDRPPEGRRAHPPPAVHERRRPRSDLRRGPDDVILTVLPLFHVFAMSSALNLGIRFGCALSLVPRFTAEAVLGAIQRDRATVFDGVPTMFVALLAHPRPRPVRHLVAAGLHLRRRGHPGAGAGRLRGALRRADPRGVRHVRDRLHDHFNVSAEDRRAYSVGKPVWGVEVAGLGRSG